MQCPRILAISVSLFACAAAIGACSANGGGDSGEDFTPGVGGSGGSAGSAGQAGNPSTGGSAIPDGGLVIETGTNDDAAPNFESEVFGQSSDMLYKLDPKTKNVSVVGKFSGCSSVIDIALDKDSNLFGTTFDGLWSINKKNAACTKIAGGSYPNSLSFVPQGTVDANEEALVGYLDSDYVRIDKSTGKVSTIGGLTGGYISSGDIVSVKGGSTFLTVKGNECGDCLFEVNPKTGDMVKNWGKIDYGSVFGLAFWAGSVYGFTDGGELFEITFNGGAIQTTEIPTGGPSDLSFWGAGSTTAAPLTPVY